MPPVEVVEQRTVLEREAARLIDTMNAYNPDAEFVVTLRAQDILMASEGLALWRKWGEGGIFDVQAARDLAQRIKAASS